VEKQTAVFLKVGASDGLAPRAFDIERRGPQDNVFAIERAVALADRHRRLPRVVPHRCEAIRFWIEAGDSGSRTFRSIRIEEGEIRLQKLAILNHVLLARGLRHNGLSSHREEGLHDVQLARELRKKLLAGPGRRLRLILIVILLRNGRRADEQNHGNGFLHGRR